MRIILKSSDNYDPKRDPLRIEPEQFNSSRDEYGTLTFTSVKTGDTIAFVDGKITAHMGKLKKNVLHHSFVIECSSCRIIGKSWQICR